METATLPGASPRYCAGIWAVDRPMRILLIAYEYPPSPSPQSLRWMYLTRELARRGHQVHVLCPDLPGSAHAPRVPDADGVHVHRTFPGPWVGLMATLSRWRAAGRRIDAGVLRLAEEQCVAGPVTLNWKGRLQTRVSKALGWFLFPDARAEWLPFARRRLALLLAETRPDVVITSHEPATSLTLGFTARQLGYPWLADLGDPVLADYTPMRWRRRAHALEAGLCRRADGLSVTTSAALQLLAERHGMLPRIARVITQGYDSSAQGVAGQRDEIFDSDCLELLYTGSFYDFRAPDALLQAVSRAPGVRLNVVSREAPEALLAAARQAPHRFRLLGHLPHGRVLSLQRGADVLVSLGNPSPVQIPGKVFEYLGAGPPILHIRSSRLAFAEIDPVTGLLEELRAGISADGTVESIVSALRRLVDEKACGCQPEGMEAIIEKRRRYSWQCIGAELEELLSAVTSAAVD